MAERLGDVELLYPLRSEERRFATYLGERSDGQQCVIRVMRFAEARAQRRQTQSVVEDLRRWSEQQRALSEACPGLFAEVGDVQVDAVNEAAYVVSPGIGESLMITMQRRPEGPARLSILRDLSLTVLRALRGAYETAGRGHGALRADSVHFGAGSKRYVLANVAAVEPPEGWLRADLLGLVDILQRLAIGRELGRAGVVAEEGWDELSGRGEVWKEICRGILECQEPGQFEALERYVERRAPAGGGSGVFGRVAAVVFVLAVLGVVGYLVFPRTPVKKEDRVIETTLPEPAPSILRQLQNDENDKLHGWVRAFRGESEAGLPERADAIYWARQALVSPPEEFRGRSIAARLVKFLDAVASEFDAEPGETGERPEVLLQPPGIRDLEEVLNYSADFLQGALGGTTRDPVSGGVEEHREGSWGVVLDLDRLRLPDQSTWLDESGFLQVEAISVVERTSYALLVLGESYRLAVTKQQLNAEVDALEACGIDAWSGYRDWAKESLLPENTRRVLLGELSGDGPKGDLLPKQFEAARDELLALQSTLGKLGDFSSLSPEERDRTKELRRLREAWDGLSGDFPQRLAALADPLKVDPQGVIAAGPKDVSDTVAQARDDAKSRWALMVQQYERIRDDQERGAGLPVTLGDAVGDPKIDAGSAGLSTLLHLARELKGREAELDGVERFSGVRSRRELRVAVQSIHERLPDEEAINAISRLDYERIVEDFRELTQLKFASESPAWAPGILDRISSGWDRAYGLLDGAITERSGTSRQDEIDDLSDRLLAAETLRQGLEELAKSVTEADAAQKQLADELGASGESPALLAIWQTRLKEAADGEVRSKLKEFDATLVADDAGGGGVGSVSLATQIERLGAWRESWRERVKEAEGLVQGLAEHWAIMPPGTGGFDQIAEVKQAAAWETRVAALKRAADEMDPSAASYVAGVVGRNDALHALRETDLARGDLETLGAKLGGSDGPEALAAYEAVVGAGGSAPAFALLDEALGFAERVMTGDGSGFGEGVDVPAGVRQYVRGSVSGLVQAQVDARKRDASALVQLAGVLVEAADRGDGSWLVGGAAAPLSADSDGAFLIAAARMDSELSGSPEDWAALDRFFSSAEWTSQAGDRVAYESEVRSQREKRGTDPAQIGPAGIGNGFWTFESNFEARTGDPFSGLRFRHVSDGVELIFVLVGLDETSTQYLCTTEMTVGLAMQIMKERSGVAWAELLKDARTNYVEKRGAIGSWVWSETGGLAPATSWEIDAQSTFNGIQSERGRQNLEVRTWEFPQPNTSVAPDLATRVGWPLVNVTPATAAEIAGSVGCTLPTMAVMDTAIDSLSGRNGGQPPNLRGEEVQGRQDTLERTLFEGQLVNCPDLFADIYAGRSSRNQPYLPADGYVYPRSVVGSPAELTDVIGNVAEWVRTGTSDSDVGIMGLSALSPAPAEDQAQRTAAKGLVRTSRVRAVPAYADVGFRLAIDRPEGGLGGTVTARKAFVLRDCFERVLVQAGAAPGSP